MTSSKNPKPIGRGQWHERYLNPESVSIRATRPGRSFMVSTILVTDRYTIDHDPGKRQSLQKKHPVFWSFYSRRLVVGFVPKIKNHYFLEITFLRKVKAPQKPPSTTDHPVTFNTIVKNRWSLFEKNRAKDELAIKVCQLNHERVVRKISLICAEQKFEGDNVSPVGAHENPGSCQTESVRPL